MTTRLPTDSGDPYHTTTARGPLTTHLIYSSNTIYDYIPVLYAWTYILSDVLHSLSFTHSSPAFVV